MRIFIVTDFNTSKRYQLVGDYSHEAAFQVSLATLGDFAHMVDEMDDVEDVEVVYNRPLSTFPTLPVVS